MDVVSPAGVDAVAHGDPSAWGFARRLGETHLVHEVRRDLRPRLIGQTAFVRVQGQRAVPDVGGAFAGADDRLGVVVPVRAFGQNLGAVLEPVEVQSFAHAQRLSVRERAVAEEVPAGDVEGAGQHALIGVLVGPARTEQVAHEPARVAPAGDVRHHNSSPILARSSQIWSTWRCRSAAIAAASSGKRR